MMHLKRLHEKYPKLKSEMDPQLSEFLSTELIDVMQADEMDRIVDVIKYVPQTVRVENVYVQGSKSDRKV